MSGWAAKRFWTEARVVVRDAGFSVELDGHPVRTPARAALCLPTRAMAEAVAAEWDAQEDRIQPATMPVTRAANAAIDKVRAQFAEVAAMIAAYGDTDLLCYRAEAPQELVRRQAEAWDPLLDWAARRYGARLVAVTGVMHAPQEARTMRALAGQVRAMDPFGLTALHDLVGLSGSLVIGLAAIEEVADMATLWRVSRIDETWQEELWGIDEEARMQALTKENAFLAAKRFHDLATDDG
ncbi:MAG: ATPase [Roseovarius sp.]|nr:ATPase [Roseovarius sp.]